MSLFPEVLECFLLYVAFSKKNVTSELSVPCKDVSLNNNELNSCSSVERIFQTNNYFTLFPNFIGAAGTHVQWL